MYKLLIVEDESAIAQGIAKSNPWEEWGFQVAGICGNGEEAVAFIERDRPDLVLSDIRMPKMDGIALMQYLNEKYPEIKIVILSGYNDFEYLQMAIRNHVAEYLLKPTLLEEFEELFRKMKNVLDEEAQQREERELQIRSRESNALLKGYGYSEEFVESFFYHRDTDAYRVVLFCAQEHAGDAAARHRLLQGGSPAEAVSRAQQCSARGYDGGLRHYGSGTGRVRLAFSVSAGRRVPDGDVAGVALGHHAGGTDSSCPGTDGVQGRADCFGAGKTAAKGGRRRKNSCRTGRDPGAVRVDPAVCRIVCAGGVEGRRHDMDPCLYPGDLRRQPDPCRCRNHGDTAVQPVWRLAGVGCVQAYGAK